MIGHEPNHAHSTPGIRHGKRLVGSIVIAATLAATATAVAVVSTTRDAPSGGRGGWTISVNVPHRSQLYPGGPPTAIAFTITSNGASRILRRIRVSVDSHEIDGDAIGPAGVVIAGCRARWFRLALGPSDRPLPVRFQQGGETYHGTIEMTMTDARVNEDACQGGLPAVRVTANS